MSDTFDMADLVALPGMPHKSIEVTPGVYVPVDESALHARKDEFIKYCSSLPQESLVTKGSLMGLTNGNETLAGLLVALADKLGVWVRHPPVQIPGLWVPELHPMVLAGSVQPKVSSLSRRVPKPSAGDLEKDLVECPECGALVGKYDSDTHEHKEAYPEGKCNLCDREEDGKPIVSRRKPEVEPDNIMPPLPPPVPNGPDYSDMDGFSAYLKAMNEP